MEFLYAVTHFPSINILSWRTLHTKGAHIGTLLLTKFHI